MNNTNQTKISFEDRMEMIRNAKASSPEAAAAKLRIIGEFPPAKVLRNTKDLTLLFDDCGLGNYDGFPGVNINHYSEFAVFFKYAWNNVVRQGRRSFLDTRSGVQFINSVVMFTSMILDRLKQKDKDMRLFNAFNMNLGDFWDAVIGTCVDSDGAIDLVRKKILMRSRDAYMSNRSRDTSLKNEIIALLNLYQRGWYSFGKIDQILICDEGLMEYILKQEEAERILGMEFDNDDSDDYDADDSDDSDVSDELGFMDVEADEPAAVYESFINEDLEQYYRDTSVDVDSYDLFIDPVGYYMKQVDAFSMPVGDFADENVRYIRREILLNNECYSKEGLEDIRKSIRHNWAIDKFDKMVNSLDFAKDRVILENAAMCMYYLLIFPFLKIQDYHYEDWAVEKQ